MRHALIPLLFATLLDAQPHPAWRHYTLNDGLPDNVVYGLCEDEIGRLYFATNSGICRFDGYQFQRFSGPEEVNAGAVFSPKIDDAGRVWFRTMGGKMFFLENDTIRTWEWNHLLEKYAKYLTTSTQFSILKDQVIELQMNGFGFVQVDVAGKTTEWANNPGFISWTETPGKLHQLRGTSQYSQLTQQLFYDKNLEPPNIIRDQNFNLDTVFNIPYFRVRSRTIGLNLGRRQYLFLTNSQICEVKNGRPKRTFYFEKKKKKNPVKLEKMPDGRFYMPCTESSFGLYVFKDLEALMSDRPDTAMLPNVEATAIHFDRSGGWWVTAHQDGLYYLPNQQMAIFDKEAGLPSEIIRNIVADSENNLYFSDGQHQVFTLNPKSLHIQPLPDNPEKSSIKYLFFDEKNKALIVGGNPQFSFKQRKWRNLNQKTPFGTFGNGFLALKSTKDGRFFYGLGLNGIDKSNALDYTLVYRGAPQKKLSDRFFDLIETPDSRIWAAKKDGLFEWVGDSVLRPVANRPEPLTEGIRQMLFTADGVLVAATATKGVSFWKENQWSQQVSEADGLTSNKVNCLVLQGDSIVWAGGNAGLNKITGFRNGEKIRVERLTVAHGLPSNQINQMAVADGFLWVASSGGLVRLGLETQKRPPIQTYLTEILVNNNKWPRSINSLAANENSLEFRFLALNFRQNGKINYRFRLNENMAWQTGIAPSALFSSLSPGNYQFEVQAQNEDSVWGVSAFFPFEIKPPWWAAWPFRTVVVLLFLGGVFAFYKWRTRQLKAQFSLKIKMAEFEQTALRAQMNPHFISNCLNSIQRCVLENDNEAAVLYLARFAKLTRTAFEFAGRPQITLAEELTYLDNYLGLEKLRFKQKFSYNITVSEGLDPRKTMLPPMLVQPLAENSIVHGFANVSDGGEIGISFLKTETTLEVRCLDNGKGLPDGFQAVQFLGAEHALHVVKTRLDLLGKAGAQSFFEIKNRGDGKTGVEATIRIG